jgi:hypothetical protein
VSNRLGFSFTRGVGERLSAPLSWDRIIELLEYGKRLKGIRVQEKTNLKGNKAYAFFSRKGLLKINVSGQHVLGSIFMSGQSEHDLEQDPLMKLFYSAVFCLQFNGKFQLTTGDKSQMYGIEQGKIYKEGSTRAIRIKNTVVEQYMSLQLIKGQTNLALDKLAEALEAGDIDLIERYKHQLSKLQQQWMEFRLLDD